MSRRRRLEPSAYSFPATSYSSGSPCSYSPYLTVHAIASLITRFLEGSSSGKALNTAKILPERLISSFLRRIPQLRGVPFDSALTSTSPFPMVSIMSKPKSPPLPPWPAFSSASAPSWSTSMAAFQLDCLV